MIYAYLGPLKTWIKLVTIKVYLVYLFKEGEKKLMIPKMMKYIERVRNISSVW